MSGGSWDYLYQQLEYPVERLKHSPIPERRAFGHLLEKVQTALHDIEWVDSNDYGEGEEIPAIRAAMGEMAVPKLLIKEAKEAMENLQKAIEAAEKAAK